MPHTKIHDTFFKWGQFPLIWRYYVNQKKTIVTFLSHVILCEQLMHPIKVNDTENDERAMMDLSPFCHGKAKCLWSMVNKNILCHSVYCFYSHENLHSVLR